MSRPAPTELIPDAPLTGSALGASSVFLPHRHPFINRFHVKQMEKA